MRVHGNAAVTGQSMRSRICQWTKLPIYFGFGESNTLTKFADHLANKNPEFAGVCNLSATSSTEGEAWMAKVDVGEVWGVGRRIADRAQSMGQKDPQIVQSLAIAAILRLPVCASVHIPHRAVSQHVV